MMCVSVDTGPLEPAVERHRHKDIPEHFRLCSRIALEFFFFFVFVGIFSQGYEIISFNVCSTERTAICSCL